MDKYFSDLRTLGQAVKRAYDFCPTMDSKVVVDYYPARAYYRNTATGQYDTHSHGAVFSYNFFNSTGKNFGVYIPDLGSIQLFAHPREWLIEKQGILDIADLVQLHKEECGHV